MHLHPHSIELSSCFLGSVFYCLGCEMIQIEFGNLLIELKHDEFLKFKSFLQQSDFKKVELENQNLPYNRKLVWQFTQSSIKAVFHHTEAAGLLNLLSEAESALLKRSFSINNHLFSMN